MDQFLIENGLRISECPSFYLDDFFYSLTALGRILIHTQVFFLKTIFSHILHNAHPDKYMLGML